MKTSEKEICPKCKKEFICSKSNKCWCFEFGLDSNQLENIAENYESCLCPNCIKELSKINSD